MINIGDEIMVYQDPVTKLNEEGIGRIVEVESEDHNVIAGQVEVRCWVQFKGDPGRYYRVVFVDAEEVAA